MTLAQRTHSAAVHLDVESRPESLTLVRSLLSAVGDALTLAPALLDDLRTAASEACNNVVLHAYDGCGPGPLMVSLVVDRAGLLVLVRDRGTGMHRVSSGSERMGVGLAVIRALADRTEFRSNSDGGTEVRMWFLGPEAMGPEADHDVGGELLAGLPSPPSVSGEIRVSVAPVSLLAPVLGRMTRAAAVQARFTADGIAEIAEVTDAVAAYAADLSVDGTVDFSLSLTTRRLELTAGPFGAVDVIAENEEAAEPRSAFTGLEQPAFEQQGDHNWLRTVIVDERVSA